jgi:hypothetical protein
MAMLPLPITLSTLAVLSDCKQQPPYQTFVMQPKRKLFSRRRILLLCCIACSIRLSAQTDIDGIMMSKNNFCTGFQYSYSSWDHYWEGKLKRTNENLGTISTQIIGWMGNYGISGKLNILGSLPYVKTKASAGTLHGLDGLQDASIGIKYQAFAYKGSTGKIQLFGVGTFSFPVSNYVADYLPLSIGLRSKNLTIRAMGDYEIKRLFITAAAAYVHRSNIKIDRTSYYTTELHHTNEVEMPDVANFHLRAGYRGKTIGAEAVASYWRTLGGFDITRNNMPFPSNRMNAIMTGVNIKCNPRALPGMSVQAGGSYTVAGRNVGQSLMVSGGLFYVFDLNRKKTTTSQPDKTK